MRAKQKKSSQKITKQVSRYNFREYRQTNWEGYFDNTYDQMMAKSRPTVPYGLKVHNFKRIIGRKLSKTQTMYMYLMEWENYELAESTWEPQSILPKNIETLFSYPEVSYEELALVARQFESAVQRSLARSIKYKSGDIPPFRVPFPLDIFRYVFGGYGYNRTVNNINGLSKLPMSTGWWYYIDRAYNRSQLQFPVTIEAKLTMRKVFKDIKGKFEWRQLPEEKVIVRLGCKLDKYSKEAEIPSTTQKLTEKEDTFC